MLKFLIEALTWGLACGMTGAAYIGIMAREEIFNAWWRFGARFEGRWFFKPVWSCSHCFAGQFALWSFLLLRIVPAPLIKPPVFEHDGDALAYLLRLTVGGLFGLIIAISAAIVSAKILTWFIQEKIK